jgi:malate dehydrogenase (oxaloacetate-decarboxylating)(NADP+)
MVPKVALLSHSNFGSSDAPTAKKMRRVAAMLAACAPDLEVDGEMHANLAISQHLRDAVNPFSRLKGQANLLIMPNLDSASIAMHLMRSMDDSLLLGPILSGTAKSAHMVTATLTAKGILNMSAIDVADAWQQRQRETGRPVENIDPAFRE